MPNIRSFSAIHFNKAKFSDLSNLISPPFDVLDAEKKAALQARHANNIVNIDLPHIPPKAAGPAEVYQKSAQTLKEWLDNGTLIKETRTALYPYQQSYPFHGRTIHRRGFFATVKLSPFGQGHVVPHEKTYKGAIEDRFELMKATGCQLSPIFGLFNDRNNEVTNLLYSNLGRPDFGGMIEDVKSDMWKVSDHEIEVKVQDMMSNKPVYIADGHHRYTTALEYQQWMIQQNGGQPLPANHPANYCMFVLISMTDPGLIIQPTHRLIGGMDRFDIERFKKEVGANLAVTETAVSPDKLGEYIDNVLTRQGGHVMALYDGRTRKTYQLKLTNLDVVKPLEPAQSEAWRRLDVAVLQRYLLDEVMRPVFAPGRELTKAYVSDASLVAGQTDGEKNQVAFILQPTPLNALEELGRHNEVMPQKSTYFYPKLATGMLINPIR